MANDTFARSIESPGEPEAVAQALISRAQLNGIDLKPLHTSGSFSREGRWISFWRKDHHPCTGSADEPLGTLHYTMQGTISLLPNCLNGSMEIFRGQWSEAGTLKSAEVALDLIISWIIHYEEVDDLSKRQIQRYGI